MSTTTPIPITEPEMQRLVEECRELPIAEGGYASENFAPYNDYMTNVLLTVLDLQMHNVAVENSISHYRKRRWDEIRTLDDLEHALAQFPDDKEGNTAAAQHL